MTKNFLIAGAALLAVSLLAGVIAAANPGPVTPRRVFRYTLTAAAVLLSLAVPLLAGALLALLKYAKRLE